MLSLKRKADILKTIRIAMPVIIGQLSFIALGLIDSMMVGRLGAKALAAVALANNYFILPLVFIFGLTAGIAPIVANQYAQKNFDNLSKVLGTSFLVVLPLCLIFTLAMIQSQPVLYALNQDPEVIAIAQPYIIFLAISILPQALFLVYKNFSEGFEFMKPPLWVGLLSIPVNALLNYLFIFGKLGFPDWGLMGAGVATLLSRIFMFIALWWILRQSSFRAYLRIDLRIKKNVLLRILKLGIPGGIQYSLEAGAFAFAAILMGMITANHLAAHQIAIQLASVSFMVIIGLSAAGSIRMGNLLGKNNWRQIHFTGWNIILLAALFMSLSALLFLVFNEWLPTLFIIDEEVITLASQMLIVAGVFQISDGLQGVCNGILRGIEDVIWPTVLILTAYWVIAIPAGAYLAFELNWEHYGIWTGLLIGLSISACLMLVRFHWIVKRHLK